MVKYNGSSAELPSTVALTERKPSPHRLNQTSKPSHSCAGLLPTMSILMRKPDAMCLKGENLRTALAPLFESLYEKLASFRNITSIRGDT